MKLSDYKKVHCIGIGGIGLSAIARYCKSEGAEVSGSDGSGSRITGDLQKEGIEINIGHDVANVKDGTDLVIYTIAANDENVELVEARSRGIPTISYPEALGWLTKEYITVAVCGTHGKTTTTAMVASMMEACGELPTVIVGSLLSKGGLNATENSVASPDQAVLGLGLNATENSVASPDSPQTNLGLVATGDSVATPDRPKGDLGTNFIKGDGKYLIVEACEYKRSFLNLHPTHVIVTNIDADHLDYYKDLEDIKSAFQSFADLIPDEGALITHSDVDLKTKGKHINADTIDRDEIELSVLGAHNRANAQLALALSKELSLDEEKSRIGLQNFTGTWRRMEYRGEYKGAKLYDDYGHHPVEIQASLQAIREKYPESKYKLVVVFQPHLYSRTKLLLDDFAKSFYLADKIYVLPIYASREPFDDSISSIDLVEKTDNAVYTETMEEIKKEIDNKYHSGSVILTVGAGDVYKLHDLLK